jgi:Arc/MetJ-type ribon-helix-helix transcriptional regulator
MNVCQNFLIGRELIDAPAALAAGPRANRSRLVKDALPAWLARRPGKDVDAAARAVGPDRFEALVAQVGRERADETRTFRAEGAGS